MMPLVMGASPPLIKIPRELRDEIIDIVLSSTPVLRPTQPNEPSVPENEHDFLNPEKIYVSPGIGLLLSSRRLRVETLQRAATIRIPYVVELAVHRDLWVVPIWTSVPLQRGPIIDRVEVNIRVHWRVPRPLSTSSVRPMGLHVPETIRLYIASISCVGASPEKDPPYSVLAAKRKYAIRSICLDADTKTGLPEDENLNGNDTSLPSFDPKERRFYDVFWREAISELCGAIGYWFEISLHNPPDWSGYVGEIILERSGKPFCYCDVSQFCAPRPEDDKITILRKEWVKMLRDRHGLGLSGNDTLHVASNSASVRLEESISFDHWLSVTYPDVRL